MDRAGQKDDKLKSYLGNVRVLTMHGKDGVWLNSQIFEGDIIAYLLADNPNARSAVGQAILNRYVYCVDPELKQMLLIERVAGATTKSASVSRAGKVNIRKVRRTFGEEVEPQRRKVRKGTSKTTSNLLSHIYSANFAPFAVNPSFGT